MDRKDRNQKMKEFYRRKVERLEKKNDKLKFTISQINDEKSDDILMKLYESEYGDKSESRILKDEDFIDNEEFIEDMIKKVFHKMVKDFFSEYVIKNNDLVKIRKMFQVLSLNMLVKKRIQINVSFFCFIYTPIGLRSMLIIF